VRVIKIIHRVTSKEVVRGERVLVPCKKLILQSELGQGLEEKEK
jgi:hypothetical protein